MDPKGAYITISYKGMELDEDIGPDRKSIMTAISVLGVARAEMKYDQPFLTFKHDEYLYVLLQLLKNITGKDYTDQSLCIPDSIHVCKLIERGETHFYFECIFPQIAALAGLTPVAVMKRIEGREFTFTKDEIFLQGERFDIFLSLRVADNAELIHYVPLGRKNHIRLPNLIFDLEFRQKDFKTISDLATEMNLIKEIRHILENSEK